MSSSSSTSQKDYDVFLSFRGTDTRHNIVSHLHKALVDNGIRTFKDDRDLEDGDIISDQLVKAIENSLFAVVVLSENYANSSWCLEELRQIMEIFNEEKIQVVPIFYKVEPSDVRHQKGSFEAAFQRCRDQRKILEWKGALTQVGNLSGKHSRTCKDEATMVADIVGNISSRLPKVKPANLIDQENLVGMEAHMVNLNLLLNMESENEVLVIGIWGMGGIGKTTIAKCLYDRFSSQFPAHHFIEDIKKFYKDKSPSCLQEKFLSNIPSGKKNGFLEGGPSEIKERLGNKKVFIVLDGVDKAEQIHALAKETTWFGLGSRIIITTRDMGLLTFCRVNSIYEVKCLEDNDSLQVFKKLAYGGRAPPSDGFGQLFIRASRLAHGLPSALVAYATYLSESTTIETWEDELLSLETRPHKHVKEILRNSYDDLDELDKTAFLHVACLLNGYPFNHVTSLLDDGRPRMNHLKAKSLISISTDGCINMHFLVAQTGREIVRLEPGNGQRFLWDPNEIYDVLNNNMGMDKTEGVILHMCDMLHTLFMSATVFIDMHNLSFLKFFQHLGDIESKVQFQSNCLQFPVKLKLLHWDAYPLETLPYSFQHHYLVELNLRYSNLESLWNEAVDQNLWKLRRLDVTGSKNLIKLPDLSTAAIEELIIEGCMRLQNIPESISRSHNLRKLNAINCELLRGVIFNVDFLNRRRQRGSWRTMLQFQREVVRLDFLTDLSIEGQLDIDLLDLYGSAEHLSFSSKQQIPVQSTDTVTPQLTSDSDSIKSLEIKQLSYLNSHASFRCTSFECFPFLTKLKLINLNIQEIAEDISDLQFLETLDLTGNDFKFLPSTMGQIAKLKYLSLQNCRKLQALPQLGQVERLTLSGCVNLLYLRGLLGVELLELRLENCSRLRSLSEELSHFTKLTYLDLSSLEFEAIPASIRELPSLGTLCLNNCKKLRSLEELPQSLSHLYAHGCDSLENVTLSPRHSIKHLDLSHCFSLDQEQDLVSQFINQGQNHQQVNAPRFACFPKAEMPIDFENRSLGTCTTISLPPIPPDSHRFDACIIVACERSFHLRFPAFSYHWNYEARGRVFRVNLKPDLYRSSELAATSHHLIIIQVPSSIHDDDEEIDELRFESHLQVLEEFGYPPGEIRSCGVRLVVVRENA